MTTRFVFEAELELNQASDFYESRKTGLGLAILNAVSSSVNEITAAPLRFPRVGLADHSREIHRFRLHRFPYSIAYEIVGGELVVLAIAHRQTSSVVLDRPAFI